MDLALTAKFEKPHSFRCPDYGTSSTRPRIKRQASLISAMIKS
jgi:hypothetical protein